MDVDDRDDCVDRVADRIEARVVAPRGSIPVAEYIVTKVRKELSSDGTREHIEGVCVNGVHYTRKQVVKSIAANNVWKTQADGNEAVIEPIAFCSKPRCTATSYIKTNPDSTRRTISRTSIVADNGANPTAAGYGGQHGITVIDCGCPLMFDPTADIGHKMMKVIYTMNGHVYNTV